LATINAIESENILQKAEENSSWFMNELNSIDDSRIKDIRGMGFMIGVEFSFETKELVNIMLKKGVLANATAGNVLRMLPPLNIEKQELEFILKILKESLKEIK
jgi:acetylornithine/N-succinyldiaminopimelate aminotransferase